MSLIFLRVNLTQYITFNSNEWNAELANQATSVRDKIRYLYHLAKDDVVIDELFGESHGVTQVHIVISWSVDQEQLIVTQMMDIPAQKLTWEDCTLTSWRICTSRTVAWDGFA